MVIAQIAIATAGHWATKDRGWDDTWIGACGLSIVFDGPTVALWLAALLFPSQLPVGKDASD